MKKQQYKLSKEYNKYNILIISGMTNYIQSVDIDVKNTIFNKELYQPIYKLIQIGIIDTGGYEYYTEDNIQNMYIHLLTKTIPKIQLDKVNTSPGFIYISIINQTKVMMRPLKRDIVNSTEYINDNIIDDDTNNHTTSLDNKIAIIRRLDQMIREQRYINKSSSIFLIGLKEYCLSKDFDVREFNLYIQEQMNICPMTYMIICSKLKIRSKILNEKCVLDKYINDNYTKK